MPSKKIPLSTPMYRNVDEYESPELVHELRDCYTNEIGTIVKRAGLLEKLELDNSITLPVSTTLTTNPIDGMYWFQESELLAVARYGNIYLLNNSSGTLSATNITSDTLRVDTPVSFCSTSRYVEFTVDAADFRGTYDLLFAANGGQIVFAFREVAERDGSVALFSTTYLQDADAPTSVTHIAILDGYLLALSGNSFYWSEVNDPLSWTLGTLGSTSGYASPEADGDTPIALHVFRREIFIFGKRTVEIWENDGETPFVRTGNGLLSIGCIAPYSVAKTENFIYWLSTDKKLVRYSGGSVDIIPTPFDREIQELTTLSDCIAHIMTFSGRDYLKLDFVSEQRTFVMSFNSEGLEKTSWGEWGYWDSESGGYSRFLGGHYCYSSDWNMHLIGGIINGKIYQLSREQYTDDNNPIRVLIRTAQINHGTNGKKRGGNIRITLKRGSASLSTTPYLAVRFRDDNRNSWSNERVISLGDLGETKSVVKFYAGGIYHNRQWEFVFSEDCGFSIADIEEDVEFLDG
jgi:hypothetical protein